MKQALGRFEGILKVMYYSYEVFTMGTENRCFTETTI